MTVIRVLVALLAIMILLLLILPRTTKEAEIEAKIFKYLITALGSTVVAIVLAFGYFWDELRSGSDSPQYLQRKITQVGYQHQRLGISGYDLSNVSPTLVTTVVQNNPEIKDLKFSEIPEKHSSVISTTINTNPRIINLSLDQVPATIIVTELSNIIPNPELKAITITRTDLSTINSKELFVALQQLPQLMSLEITEANLTTKDVAALLEFLANSKLMAFTLKSNKLYAEDITKIQEQLEQLTTLQEKDIAHNSIFR